MQSDTDRLFRLVHSYRILAITTVNHCVSNTIYSLEIPHAVQRMMLVVLLILLLSSPAQADNDNAVPSAVNAGLQSNAWPVIDVASLDQPTVSIMPQLLYQRREHEDRATADALRHDTAWSPVGEAVIASAFTPATIWLAGRLQNTSDTEIVRTVRIARWRLHQVDISLFDTASGRLLIDTPVGLAALRDSGQLDIDLGARPGITLTLPPGSDVLLMVRVNDRSIPELDVALWAPDATHRQLQHALVWETALLVTAIVIAMVLLLQLKWSFAIAAAFILFSTVFELAYERPLLIWLLPSLADHLIPLFTITGAAAIVGLNLFSLAMLGVFRHRALLRAYSVVGIVMLGAGLSTLVVEAHELARYLVTHLGLVLMVLWPLVAWVWRDRNLPYGGLLASMLTLLWLSALVRLIMASIIDSMPRLSDVLIDSTLTIWLGSLLLSFVAQLTAIGVAVMSSRGLREREARARALAEERRFGETFARGVVHDVNNLLTVLALELHALDAPEGEYTPEQRQAMIAMARQIIEQGATLARGSLMLSVSDPLRSTPVDVDALLTRLQSRMRETVSPDVRLVREDTGTVPHAWTCEPALELSLMNMILNADQAISGDGEIRLRVAVKRWVDSPQLDLGVLPDRTCLVVSIEDTGHGIPKAVRERLFEPRTSTRQAIGNNSGHGLGLFMVGQFVRKSDAGLRVGSSPEGGARFELLLPIAETRVSTIDTADQVAA